MCGIFGVIASDPSSIIVEEIVSARDALIHRGPDDKGIWISEDNCTALAHRRLSIIDLSKKGKQPITTADSRYTIIFNGEIYNYRELTKYLESKKIHLKSTSDTEVLLYLFALEQEKCLDRLRGMFAFAIWDNQKKILFAARDRFGIKPFYYALIDNQFIFASEIKAIKKYKNKLTLSMQGADAFLKTGSIPVPMTIYSEVFTLPPAWFLVYQVNKEINLNQWWQFESLYSEAKEFNDEAKEEVHEVLLESIKMHCVSDVEVGAFLSGGVDSTAIVSLMRQIGHERIKTISVTFPGNRLDESRYSKIAADTYGTEHYEYNLTEKELIEHFDRLINSMDQPTIDGLNTYFVSKAAKDLGLKVVMSGIGGDELFGGYPTFKYIPKLEQINSLLNYVPLIKSSISAAAKFAGGRAGNKFSYYLNHSNEKNAPFKLFRGLFTENDLSKLGWRQNFEHPYDHTKRSDYYAGTNRDRSSMNSFNINELHTNGFCLPTVMQKISHNESVFYMANQLLRDSDIYSMQHSLELRVPFVDHILYKTVFPYIDSPLAKKPSKNLLISATGDLPIEITHRPKMGFTFPFADWFKSGLLRKKIEEIFFIGSPYFNQSELNNLFTQFSLGNVHWSRIWALTVLQKFIEN
jgi:asparagine synthase (glutamine-hydrolysing)